MLSFIENGKAFDNKVKEINEQTEVKERYQEKHLYEQRN